MGVKVSLKVKLLTVIVGLIVVCSVVQGTLVQQISSKALNGAVSKAVDSMADKVALELSIRNSEEFRFVRNLAMLPMINGDEYTTEEKCAQLVSIAKGSSGRYVNISFYEVILIFRSVPACRCSLVTGPTLRLL